MRTQMLRTTTPALVEMMMIIVLSVSAAGSEATCANCCTTLTLSKTSFC